MLAIGSNLAFGQTAKAPPESAPPQPFLGIGVDDTERGVVVTALVPGSPGQFAGIKREDVIVSFGNKSISTIREISDSVAKNRPGDSIVIVIQRGEEQITKSLVFVTAPPPGYNELFEIFESAAKDRNAEPLAARLSLNADIIDQHGTFISGRAQVREFLLSQFADETSLTLSSAAEHVRFVTPSVLIISGSCTWKTQTGRYTMIWSAAGNHWNIEALRLVSSDTPAKR